MKLWCFLYINLTKKIKRERLPIENIFYIFGPVLLVFILVAKDNGSTALMILMVSLAVMLVGQLSAKYILGFLGISGLFVGIFLFLALKTDLIVQKNHITNVSTSKAKILCTDHGFLLDDKEAIAAYKKEYASDWDLKYDEYWVSKED